TLGKSMLLGHSFWFAPTTTVSRDSLESLYISSTLKSVASRKGSSLSLVRQPRRRVTGSSASVSGPMIGKSVVKWLTITILPPGRQNALRLNQHPNRIRHYCDGMKGRHIVKAVITKSQIERVHFHDLQMRPVVFGDFCTRLGEHLRRQVGPDNLAMARISRK